MIALRPECDGRITGYSGVDGIERRFGDAIVVETGEIGNQITEIQDRYMSLIAVMER